MGTPAPVSEGGGEFQDSCLRGCDFDTQVNFMRHRSREGVPGLGDSGTEADEEGFILGTHRTGLISSNQIWGAERFSRARQISRV